jgi:glutathione S-transferase
MQYPILYSFRRCPYAIRARISLAKAGINWAHREVSLKNKPAEMIALSNKGTVPVLQFKDDQVIDESLDVMLWALEQNDPDHWLDADMHQALKLINENDLDFKNDLDCYKYYDRYPEHCQEYYRDRGEQFLIKINDLLEQNNGAGLISKRLSLADVAIFPFIRQFAGVDRDWFEQTSYHYMINWLKEWEQHNDFLSIMQKYKFWTSDC